MSDAVYKKLKKQNGERFARTLRDYHNGLLEIPDITGIVRYSGRDARPLLPYLMRLLAANENAAEKEQENIQDPFELLDQAGYEAFHADTLEKQNSIQPYFEEDELLCTFNDAARFEEYHIIHAIKKDVAAIKRADFRGIEKRQDEYGTSVISIQMQKEGGFISIKNRYNHTVNACDNTFGSQPDNIIKGLSASLKAHFNVDFTPPGENLPYEYTMMNGQIIKYHYEWDNDYYGNQFWARDGKIHPMDRGKGDALFEYFKFDAKSKRLEKINPILADNLVDNFNAAYGGNKDLRVDKDGNLTLRGEILIGAKNSQITSLYLPDITKTGRYFGFRLPKLQKLNMPDLEGMGEGCFYAVFSLEDIILPKLQKAEKECLELTRSVKSFYAPLLENGELRERLTKQVQKNNTQTSAPQLAI